MDYFDPYNVLLAIATNIPMLLMTGFIVQGHICLELLRTCFTCKQCLISVFPSWFRQDIFTGESNIIDERHYFKWKQRFAVKNVVLMDLFITNMQLSASLGWCGILWCFYQLSRLILMAPIHYRGSIGEEDEELTWSQFSSNFLF